VKKDQAAYRYIDEKAFPLYSSETQAGGVERTKKAPFTFNAFVKRTIDITFSAFVIVFGFPFFLLLVALIKLTSEGPVFYVQNRVGLNETPFKFYKFRTMTNGTNDDVHRSYAENFIKGNVTGDNGSKKPVFKLTADPRVTSMGRFLRRTSLDELPQFFNILKGEMTLVGPRPPCSYEIDHYQKWHKKRLLVKPGLTGLWQVSGRSSVPFDEMVHLDLRYIDEWSLMLDIKIILRTIPVMFRGSGGY
jgi:lipopolysaccharide/colanic/teichoic acid biosynthesis glycosyltransferase